MTCDAVKAAFSKGEFFNRRIRDRFSFERNREELPAVDSRHAESETWLSPRVPVGSAIQSLYCDRVGRGRACTNQV
jgi:hypothetical protein